MFAVLPEVFVTVIVAVFADVHEPFAVTVTVPLDSLIEPLESTVTSTPETPVTATADAGNAIIATMAATRVSKTRTFANLVFILFLL